MAQKTNILFPKTEAVLKELGENIRLARLRRNITAKLEAERAGIGIATQRKIESGSPAVAMGNYMQVLFTLGLEQDVRKVALDDELGRKLQDAGLSLRRRASKRAGKETNTDAPSAGMLRKSRPPMGTRPNGQSGNAGVGEPQAKDFHSGF